MACHCGEGATLQSTRPVPPLSREGQPRRRNGRYAGAALASVGLGSCRPTGVGARPLATNLCRFRLGTGRCGCARRLCSAFWCRAGGRRRPRPSQVAAGPHHPRGSICGPPAPRHRPGPPLSPGTYPRSGRPASILAAAPFLCKPTLQPQFFVPRPLP